MERTRNLDGVSSGALDTFFKSNDGGGGDDDRWRGRKGFVNAR